MISKNKLHFYALAMNNPTVKLKRPLQYYQREKCSEIILTTEMQHLYSENYRNIAERN